MGQNTSQMTDTLTLEVNDLVVDVLTGIYSEETGKPQPLRMSIAARYAVADRYDPDTPLEASKNYMDLKFAASEGLPKGVHFKLIEAVNKRGISVLLVEQKSAGRDLVRAESCAMRLRGVAGALLPVPHGARAGMPRREVVRFTPPSSGGRAAPEGVMAAILPSRIRMSCGGDAEPAAGSMRLNPAASAGFR